jgi:hypothetical protein
MVIFILASNESGARLAPGTAWASPTAKRGGPIRCHRGAAASLLAMAARGGKEMTVFYRGPCARITHLTFETWRPQHRIFIIRELRHVVVIDADRTGAYELRAYYRGVPTILYASSSRREFGQVRRGLMRAIEFITDT